MPSLRAEPSTVTVPPSTAPWIGGAGARRSASNPPAPVKPVSGDGGPWSPPPPHAVSKQIMATAAAADGFFRRGITASLDAVEHQYSEALPWAHLGHDTL